MNYEMSCMAHEELENNLPMSRKNLALTTNKDHSSESSSNDDLELLTIKLKSS